MYEVFGVLQMVFVIGSSVGVILFFVYVCLLKDYYVDVCVVQFGDGVGGYCNIVENCLYEVWGMFVVLLDFLEIVVLLIEDFIFELFYIMLGFVELDVVFSCYDMVEDLVQIQFFKIGLFEVDEL